MAAARPKPIEGPFVDADGNDCLGIWAEEGGVLLILQRTAPHTVRFHALNTAGLPSDFATLSSFRWERVRKFIDPNSTVDGGSS
jgi:hypothetical protein